MNRLNVENTKQKENDQTLSIWSLTVSAEDDTFLPADS